MSNQADKSVDPKNQPFTYLLSQENAVKEQIVKNFQLLDDSARIVDSTLDIFKELIPD